MRIMLIVIVGLVVFISPTTRLLAAPPGVEIEMAVPMKRRITNIAERDGSITLAGERAVGLYTITMHGQPNEALRRACASLPFEQRVRCVECFPFMLFEMELQLAEEVRANEEIIQYAEALCMPGYTQDKIRKDIESAMDRRGDRLADQMEPYIGLRLRGQYLWDDRIYIDALGVKQNGRSGPYGKSIHLVGGADDPRYYINYENTQFIIPRIPTGVNQKDVLRKDDIYPVIDAPPEGARILRYRIDPESPPEKRRLFIEEISNRNNIKFDDMIMYIKDQPYPSDASPFLEIDPGSLDEAGRQLQRAIKAHLMWEIDDEEREKRAEEALSYWHPEDQEYIRPQIERNQKRAKEMMSTGEAIGRINYLRMLPSGSDFDRDAPQIRIASRVLTDKGVAWFAWVPQPNADEPSDVFVKVFCQILTPADGYKLVLPGDQTSPEGEQRDRRAMFLLNQRAGHDYWDSETMSMKPDLRDIVGILTRHQREAQLGVD